MNSYFCTVVPETVAYRKELLYIWKYHVMKLANLVNSEPSVCLSILQWNMKRMHVSFWSFHIEQRIQFLWELNVSEDIWKEQELYFSYIFCLVHVKKNSLILRLFWIEVIWRTPFRIELVVIKMNIWCCAITFLAAIIFRRKWKVWNHHEYIWNKYKWHRLLTFEVFVLESSCSLCGYFWPNLARQHLSNLPLNIFLFFDIKTEVCNYLSVIDRLLNYLSDGYKSLPYHQIGCWAGLSGGLK